MHMDSERENFAPPNLGELEREWNACRRRVDRWNVRARDRAARVKLAEASRDRAQGDMENTLIGLIVTPGQTHADLLLKARVLAGVYCGDPNPFGARMEACIEAGALGEAMAWAIARDVVALQTGSITAEPVAAEVIP